MSDVKSHGLLAAISEELVALTEKVLPCSAAISGTAADFSDVSGSGFLLDDEGHLVTNCHVVEGLEDRVRVRLVDSPHVHATIVGTDPLTDLAVLALDEYPSRHLELRDSDVRRGELCFVFGSPLGLFPESITCGIVSGTNRRIARESSRPLEGMIQTDAAINPGNSGGPLVDVAGKTIGVNTCITTGATGIGFAVPADTVKLVAGELIEHGRVERATLGAAVTPRMVEMENAQVPRLAITRVASRGGLKVDDVLIQVAGHEIHGLGDLFKVLRRDYIGREIDINVMREGKHRVVKVTPDRLGDGSSS
jgi:S1-C subfamily serine protease